MNLKKILNAGLSLALFCVLAIPGIVMAGEYDQATKVTFNEPVEIPGRVLDAGTYWFTLMDPGSGGDIVQVWTADRSQLVATVLTVADYRLKPTGKTVLNFEEGPSDQPQAIQAWFYPGDNFGHEFVYPKTRATALAQQIHQPVLAIPEGVPTDAIPSPRPAMKAIAESGEEIEVSEVIAAEPTPNVVLASLPQTASLLGVCALLGFAALAASLYFRRVARNNA
jgi:hypothetical protein